MENQYIKLDQYLKLAGAVNSGGEAKHLIQGGAVMVNGQIETRRGRKLVAGDLVKYDQKEFKVVLDG
ncbi:MAG: RNA-binding S4 domain-containing protein [Candidatus Obscuribacterales bacterium]|nr:RNA-binding S4 domain-containing protein [Candidatus Obscuribacterales bacterium]